MATRSVSTYLGLERGLADALRRGDRDAVLKQLSNDFTAYTPTANDEGQSANAWLASELRHPASETWVRDLNVREIGELAMVSFLLDQRYQRGGKTTSTTFYVVDVWRQTPQQLLARYVSRPTHVAPRPARPSGKE
jgi:ketosteroid isomerase-like protein